MVMRPANIFNRLRVYYIILYASHVVRLLLWPSLGALRRIYYKTFWTITQM